MRTTSPRALLLPRSSQVFREHLDWWSTLRQREGWFAGPTTSASSGAHSGTYGRVWRTWIVPVSGCRRSLPFRSHWRTVPRPHRSPRTAGGSTSPSPARWQKVTADSSASEPSPSGHLPAAWPNYVTFPRFWVFAASRSARESMEWSWTTRRWRTSSTPPTASGSRCSSIPSTAAAARCAVPDSPTTSDWGCRRTPRWRPPTSPRGSPRPPPER